MRGPPPNFQRFLLCAVLGLCGFSSVFSAPIYYWVDAQGIKHWSDRPVPGSTVVESHTTAPQPPIPLQNDRRPFEAKSPKPAVALYTSLEVIQPTAESTLTATSGTVECVAQLTPPLAPGDAIWFEIDGNRYDGSGSLSLTLPAPRGAHVLRALVLSADGGVQIESAPVTFYVRQASLIEPPVGPALKKPR